MKKALCILLFIAVGYISSAQDARSRTQNQYDRYIRNTTAKITDTLKGARMGTYGLSADSPEVLLSPLAVIPGAETQVPERVMTRIKTKYGKALYDVKAVIDLTGQIVYIARVVDRGVITAEYLDEFGNSIVSPYLK